jgi:hypothetical protein
LSRTISVVFGAWMTIAAPACRFRATVSVTLPI